MDGIQTEGFVQQSRELDHLMMSNPDMENMVRRLIRKVIAKAPPRLIAVFFGDT